MTKKTPPPEEEISIKELLHLAQIPESLIQPLIDDTIQAYNKWREIMDTFVDPQPAWSEINPVQQFSLVIMHASSIEAFLHRVPAMTVAPLTDTIQ